jgi:hypothetical protein
MKKEWYKTGLIFFLLVAIIGTILRSIAFFPIPLNLGYGNLVHAHSHVAFQGWVYTIIFLLLTHFYLTKEQVKAGRYPLQFKLTIVFVVGILISFSLQGYGLYSILFSTLFQFLNYWFIYRFLNDTKKLKSISLRFVRAGLFFGVLSTLLPYGIGVLSAKGMAGTEIYQSTVYAFMHLQYNGWFLFIILGLFFKFFETNHISVREHHAKRFYWLFTIATIPAISLSLLGTEYATYILPVAYASSILLALGLVYFFLSFKGSLLTAIRPKSKWFQMYFVVFLVSFLLKTLLQSLSVLPALKLLAFFNKSIILAYLHLTLIGCISFILIAMLIEIKWISIKGYSKVGSILLILGFLITEGLLILGGLNLFYVSVSLVIGSAAMVLGILFLLLNRNNKLEEHGEV